MEKSIRIFCVISFRNILLLLLILLLLPGISGCSDPVAASAKSDSVEVSSKSQSNAQVKTISKTNEINNKEERIRKEKAFEAGLSKEEIKALVTITPGPISTTFERYSSDPYLYYNEFTQSLNYVPGKTWQSVDGSAVTFYITNPLKYTHLDSIKVKISGKTLKREDDMYVWPVTSDSKTETITDLKPGESRKIVVYFETEVDIQSKGGTIASIGAGFSNVLAKGGKIAGNKGFRVAMNPDTIRFDISDIETQYVGDFDEKLKTIIDSAKTNFETIRVESSIKSSNALKQWDSSVTLPYTEDNKIRYWNQYGEFEFRSRIVESEDTIESRLKTKDFIKMLEQTLGKPWIKKDIPSDIRDIYVVFQNGTVRIEIIGQKYASIELYQTDLEIEKMKIQPHP